MEAGKNRVDRWKIYVELLTLVVITIYTIIAYHQWTAMRDATIATEESADAAKSAADTAIKTLIQTNQAILVYGDPQSFPGDQIMIPVTNRGKATATINKGTAFLFRIKPDLTADKIMSKLTPEPVPVTREVRTEETDLFAVYITPEPFPHGASIIVDLQYDNGFHTNSILTMCISYNPKTLKWTKGCGRGAGEIDFRKAQAKQKNYNTSSR
jgi:hypothetical protein